MEERRSPLDEMRELVLGADEASEDAFQAAAQQTQRKLWGCLLALDAMLDPEAATSGKMRLLIYMEQFCREVIDRFDALGEESWEQAVIDGDCTAGDLEALTDECQYGRSLLSTQLREEAGRQVDGLMGANPGGPLDGAEVVR